MQSKGPMLNLYKTLSVLVLAGFFCTAQAADAPPSADIRCLVVGSLMLANSTDATQRNAGTMMSVYWLGRLDAFSAQQIEDAMVSESATITPAQIQTETVRCAEIFQAKGQMMQEIGKNIMRREKNKQNASPAKAPNDSKPSQ
jgi:hypothetical protein